MPGGREFPLPPGLRQVPEVDECGALAFPPWVRPVPLEEDCFSWEGRALPAPLAPPIPHEGQCEQRPPEANTRERRAATLRLLLLHP
jgi:hypothetical protein